MQTASKQINLKADTLLTSGYLGRGQRTKSLTLAAGTPVTYTRTTLGDGTLVHEVFSIVDGVRYSATKRETPKITVEVEYTGWDYIEDFSIKTPSGWISLKIYGLGTAPDNVRELLARMIEASPGWWKKFSFTLTADEINLLRQFQDAHQRKVAAAFRRN